MWRPPERRRFTAPPGAWPALEEVAQARLFQPIQVGPIELAERTWVPAMVPWRATEEGYVTEQVRQWYARFAHGQPGALVAEATGIREIPSGPLLRISHDRFLPGLRELVDGVRRSSGGRTKFFIQIIDFLSIRRRPKKEKYISRYLEVRPRHRQAVGLSTGTDAQVRESLLSLSETELQAALEPREWEDLSMGYRERVTDMDLEWIRELPLHLPGLFAAAARRAAQAGFDGVELHFAHAYTMASFLSALNTRSDGYGGDREGRVRLALEVIEAVREAVPSGFVVGSRFLTEEAIEGGSGVDDACYFGRRFAEAGLDFLSLSRGGKFEDARQPAVGWAAYPYTGPSGYECMPTVLSDAIGPFGRNVAACARVREAVREAGYAIPVVVSGGICSFGQAEAILEQGQADIIGAARQSLADPDWFRKLRLGRGAEIRRCSYTNYCEGLDQKHKQVTCRLWDRSELDEAGVSLSSDGKRRLVAPSWSGESGQPQELEEEPDGRD